MTVRPKHIRSLILLFLIVLGTSSCVFNELFVLKDPNYSLRPGTIAVISGTDAEADMKLAQFLTSELKQYSTLRVIPQDEVRRKVPGYPIDLIDRSKTKGEKDPAVFPGNKAKLDALQKQVRADHLFVIWDDKLVKTISQTSTLGTSRTSRYEADVRGLLIAYPQGRIVGHSAVPAFENVGLFSSKSESEHIDAMLKQGAYLIRAKFTEATKTAKGEK